jgi:hypothetical protein
VPNICGALIALALSIFQSIKYIRFFNGLVSEKYGSWGITVAGVQENQPRSDHAIKTELTQ